MTTPLGEMFMFTVDGDYSLMEKRTALDWIIRPALRTVPGVADVASVGGFVKQYQVVLDPNALDAYKLSIDQVVRAVRSNNNDVGGRLIEFAGAEFMVRGRGYIKNLEDALRDQGIGCAVNILRSDSSQGYLQHPVWPGTPSRPDRVERRRRSRGWNRRRAIRRRRVGRD